MKRFTCAGCTSVVFATGGNTGTRCQPCRLKRRGARGIAQLEAHMAVARAVRTGVLPRASAHPCADCGGAADRYDHRDYLKPLDVQPVCRSCNQKRGPAGFPGRGAAAPAPDRMGVA